MLLDILSNQNKICEINYKMINSISQNNDFRPRKDPKTNTAKLTNAGKKSMTGQKKIFPGRADRTNPRLYKTDA